jgi:hypothetical protein
MTWQTKSPVMSYVFSRVPLHRRPRPPIRVRVVCHVNTCGVVSRCFLHYLMPLYSPCSRDNEVPPNNGGRDNDDTVFSSSVVYANLEP